MLEKLATDTSEAVAINPSSPGWLLHRLVGSDDRHTRLAVARHKQTTSEDLAILAQDQRQIIREAIAARSRLDESMSRLLLEDQVTAVSAALGRNEETPSGYSLSSPGIRR